jgi:hypothetical protein
VSQDERIQIADLRDAGNGRPADRRTAGPCESRHSPGELAQATRVIQDADVEDKAAGYAGLNLVLTYHPENRRIQANAQLAAESDGLIVGVRAGERTDKPMRADR